MVKLGVLTGHMIEVWKNAHNTDFESMKDMTRAKFDLKGLNKILIDNGIVPDPDEESKMTEEEKFQLKVDKYQSL